jgi:hypothetical protein
MTGLEKYNDMIMNELINVDEDFESYENLDNLTGIQLKQVQQKLMQRKGGFGSPMQKAATGKQGTAAINPNPDSYVGQIDLKIWYDRGTTLNEVLPVPFFAPIQRYGFFKGIEYTETGRIVNLQENPVANGADLIRYSNGADEAIIYIEGMNFDYMTLLEAIKNDEFEISKIRLLCEKGLDTFFFTTGIKTYGRTSFGKHFSNDSIPFISQNSPVAYKDNILDLDFKMNIQKDLGYVYNMPKHDIIQESALIMSLFIKRFIRK